MPNPQSTEDILAFVLEGLASSDAERPDASTLLTLAADAPPETPPSFILCLLRYYTSSSTMHHLCEGGESVATRWWRAMLAPPAVGETAEWRQCVVMRMEHLRVLAAVVSLDTFPSWESGNEAQARAFFEEAMPRLNGEDAIFVTCQVITSGLLSRLRGEHDAPVLSAFGAGITAAIAASDDPGDLETLLDAWDLATTPASDHVECNRRWEEVFTRAADGEWLSVGLARCLANSDLVPEPTPELRGYMLRTAVRPSAQEDAQASGSR